MQHCRYPPSPREGEGGQGDEGHTDQVKGFRRSSPHPQPLSLGGRGASERMRTTNLARLPLLHGDGEGGWGDEGFQALGRDRHLFG
jgi:hypothetical protein